ncbi:N-alpha-acetyltransferase 40 isoform X1 [Dioscorea cayenensis subsp. rotundata]|uniref:N-alpha-acetyltransferase 40 n=1 Tax=Dioscorea cayennensis subsp. rotundata TaxID=55577 RepID=A0AB40BL41_DIOCR|nr:N-alpha-acetyltransferase 40 isoform X1 [Dioscorea cayenensis subsp. rotundata]
MEPNRLTNSKERILRRKEVLEKKKAIDDIIKAASAVKDQLASFLPFRQYDRHGLSLYLDSGFGEHLTSSLKKYIKILLKVNMEGPYGSEWPVEEKIKRREMVAPQARYIFVRSSSPNATLNDKLDNNEEKVISGHWIGDGDPVVAFVHYRFVIEEEVPVLYVFELQLESLVQRKGLGKFLMQLLELIAHKNRMGAVILTVQKANTSAFDFYINKLRYSISSISPSRVNPLIGAEASYEILCKTFDAEAKAKLEE